MPGYSPGLSAGLNQCLDSDPTKSLDQILPLLLQEVLWVTQPGLAGLILNAQGARGEKPFKERKVERQNGVGVAGQVGDHSGE